RHLAREHHPPGAGPARLGVRDVQEPPADAVPAPPFHDRHSPQAPGLLAADEPAGADDRAAVDGHEVERAVVLLVPLEVLRDALLEAEDAVSEVVDSRELAVRCRPGADAHGSARGGGGGGPRRGPGRAAATGAGSDGPAPSGLVARILASTNGSMMSIGSGTMIVVAPWAEISFIVCR